MYSGSSPMRNSKTENHICVRTFESLSQKQRSALAELQISQNQIEFGGDFSSSVQEIEAAPVDLCFGAVLFTADTIAGLCIFKRPPFAPNWAHVDAITLHGLKIDQNWQGEGFRRRLMIGGIQMAIARWPEARRLQLMVDASNDAALGLYRSFNMQDSGPVFRGRIGHEHRFEAPLVKFLI